jgi:glycine cleavage system regulatory protein
LEEAVGEGGGGRGVGEDGCVRTESRRSGIGRRGARVAEEEGQNNSTDEFEEFFDMIPLHEVSLLIQYTHTYARARTHTHKHKRTYVLYVGPMKTRLMLTCLNRALIEPRLTG